MREKVSIIMPSYNSEEFIAESINSVLAQTYENFELLIVDDCSTDKTVEVVESFNDDRIKLFVNEKNSGAAVSRNRAIREATGKWIAFLDSDDLWFPDKLEKQVDFMEKKGYHFSYTEYMQIDEHSDSTGVIVKTPAKVTKRMMFRYCYLGCLTVMYDREYVGLIQIENLAKRNDYAIWLKVSQKATAYGLPEVLAKYRVRSGSISSGSKLALIKHHYRLFRIGEHMNPIRALWHTFVNLIFGVGKKLFYVKKTETNK